MTEPIITPTPEPTPNPAPEPTVTPPANGDRSGTPTGDDKKFTQADLDRMIQERLERERKKYADYDSIKKQLGEVQNSSKTDLQKMQDRLSELTDKFTAAEAVARAKALESAIVAAAARLEFNDPQDAYELLKNKLTVDDDGAITGLDTALGKLLNEKPYLKKAPKGAISPTNPSGGDRLTIEAIKKMTPAQINARWDEVQKVLAG